MNTQQSEEWVDRFREAFVRKNNGGYPVIVYNEIEDFLDFIRTLRAEAVEEGRNMAVDYIEANCVLDPFVEQVVEEARTIQGNGEKL